MAKRDGGTSLVIDVGAAGEEYDRVGIRPRRYMLIGVVVFGILVIFGGLALLGTRFSSGLLFVVGGIALLAVALLYAPRIPRGIRKLELDGEGIVFYRVDGKQYRANWTDRGNLLTVYDWSSLGPSQKSGALRSVDFVLSARFPAEGSFKKTQIEVILDAARNHGLVLEGWKQDPPPPGQSRVIRVYRST